MTAALSGDLRGRIVAAVEGGSSARQAAARFAVSPSAAVRLMHRVRETGWREDRRREPNGAQVRRMVGLALGAPPSVDFCGYWQRVAQV